MLQFDLKLCGECGGCVAVCPVGALEILSDGLRIRRDLCTLCDNCVIFCPVGAFLPKTDPPPKAGQASQAEKIKTFHAKTSSSSLTKISDPENG